MSTSHTTPHLTAINAAIEAGGLTQTRIAEALGITQPAVSRRMSGRTEWSLSEVGVLAGLLGVSVTDLLAGVPAQRGETIGESA